MYHDVVNYWSKLFEEPQNGLVAVNSGVQEGKDCVSWSTEGEWGHGTRSCCVRLIGIEDVFWSVQRSSARRS